MANQEYTVTGTLTTTWAGADLTTLQVVAYRSTGPRSLQAFAKAKVDAKGRFELSFDHGAVGSTMAVDLMPIPKALSTPGVFEIENWTPGLLYPKLSIGARDCKKCRCACDRYWCRR